MKVIVLVLIVLIIPSFAFAQEREIPKEAIEELSKDLLKLHEQVIRIQEMYRASQLAGRIEQPSMAAWMVRPADKITITKDDFPIRTGANSWAKKLSEADSGASYTVVDKVNDWYAIELDKPVQGFKTGWVNAKGAVPVLTATTEEPSESAFARMYRDLVETAANFRDKYLDNEYFYVKGFSIEIGLSAAPLSIDFEFRE